MVKDKLNTSPCDGGQPVSNDAQAAAALAQGHEKSKRVPQSWGQKDQDSGADSGFARKGSSDPYGK